VNEKVSAVEPRRWAKDLIHVAEEGCGAEIGCCLSGSWLPRDDVYWHASVEGDEGEDALALGIDAEVTIAIEACVGCA
jgi:hypothetical protein